MIIVIPSENYNTVGKCKNIIRLNVKTNEKKITGPIREDAVDCDALI